MSARMELLDGRSRYDSSDSVGRASIKQCLPYRTMLRYDEQFRFFTDQSVEKLLDMIPGEMGKVLRRTFETCQDLPQEEYCRVHQCIISAFYRNLDHPKDVRFLPSMSPDGSSVPNDPSQYPIAIRRAIFH